MVHVQRSLQEVWRVLVPGGILVDMHPINYQLQLEVVFAGQRHFAGLLDAEHTLERRKMAEQGLHEVVENGRFTRTRQEEFISRYYWDSVDAMEAHYIERESKTIRPPHVLDKARRIMAEIGDEAQVSVTDVLMIGRYEKI